MFFDNMIPPAKVRTNLFGRRRLISSRPMNEDWRNIAEIMNDMLPLHTQNADETNYLYWYYRGNQPVINRIKTVRPEINNISVENRAFEIVEFKKGYEFSHPVQYTNAGQDDDAPVDVLNTYARLDSKEPKDIALAEWMYIAGHGYRIVLPNKTYDIRDNAPYYTETLDPRYTFVVYSNDVLKRPIIAGTRVKRAIKKEIAIVEQHVYGVYTEAFYYEWVFDGQGGDFTMTEPTIRANSLGMIPIVEYALNESLVGYVELCVHLFNAINEIGSNRIDAIEQFVQALLVFLNCELPIDEATKTKYVPRVGDAIEIPGRTGTSADVKYVTAQLDQSQTQLTKEDLLNAVYEICGAPDRKSRGGGGGGDTGQAVILRDGWGVAEARARTTEKLFKKSEMECLRIILRICRDTRSAAAEIGDLSLRHIDVKISRNRSDNMQVKSQALQTLLAAGVEPEIAYEICELFSDPAAAWKKSKRFQDEDAQWVENKLRIARGIGTPEQSAVAGVYDGEGGGGNGVESTPGRE